jgi:hypothetical protein
VSAGICSRFERDVAGEVGQGRRDAAGVSRRGLGSERARRTRGGGVAEDGRGAEPEAGVFDRAGRGTNGDLGNGAAD